MEQDTDSFILELLWCKQQLEIAISKETNKKKGKL